MIEIGHLMVNFNTYIHYLQMPYYSSIKIKESNNYQYVKMSKLITD